MTKMLISGDPKKKRRGLVLHGAHNSGKSTISRYAGNIFSSHNLKYPDGKFFEKLDREDTHKQILRVDEADVKHMFNKGKLHDTKQLLEGDGMKITVKFEHPFTGFIGAYTIITCNNLPYPFIPPNTSLSGFTLEEYPHDKGAINVRTSVVYMTKSHAEEEEFPFTEEQFAFMMLSMKVFEKEYPEYKAPYDVNEFSPQKTT